MPVDASGHDHELDAEYIYPADADVLNVYEQDGTLHVDVAVVCPECSETVALRSDVTAIEETDVELPLDEEFYK